MKINKYSTNKYDWIISFSDNIEEIIKIINMYKETNYMFKKVVEKNEILNKCNVDIQQNKILLTNHFRIQINKYLSWKNNDTISESIISNSTYNSNYESLEIINVHYQNQLWKSQ